MRLRAPSLSLALALAFAALRAAAQAPVLQDGADALRRARLAWTAGEPPLGPSSMPSLEVGWGGADSEGAYAPLIGGEGLGQVTRGWGLGLQGRYTSGGFSVAATLLGLRDQGSTRGTLQRAALAYQTDSGWRLALEQTPIQWGSGLLGGELLGDAARPFPRLSLATPEVSLLQARWRLEAFAGRLGADRPIPAWISDREQRLLAREAGLDLQRPLLQGALLRAGLGPLVELSLGAVAMRGGEDARGATAPEESTRTQSLFEAKARIPALARLLRARGASLQVSRGAAPDSSALTLASGRDLAGLVVVWEGWDLGLEYAEAAPHLRPDFSQPSHLAWFSTHGDPLAAAFGREAITRAVVLGLPLFLEGRGSLRAVRATAALDHPNGTGSWFLQGDAQWRTSTGRVGASLASRQDGHPGSPARWGWSCSLFQSFRVF